MEAVFVHWNFSISHPSSPYSGHPQHLSLPWSKSLKLSLDFIKGNNIEIKRRKNKRGVIIGGEL